MRSIRLIILMCLSTGAWLAGGCDDDASDSPPTVAPSPIPSPMVTAPEAADWAQVGPPQQAESGHIYIHDLISDRSWELIGPENVYDTPVGWITGTDQLLVARSSESATSFLRGRPPQPMEIIGSIAFSGYDHALSPDGRLLSLRVSNTLGPRIVRVVDTEDWSITAEVNVPARGGSAWSAAGDFLAIPANDESGRLSTHIWSRATGEVEILDSAQVAWAHGSSHFAYVRSSDGPLPGEGTLIIRDANSGEEQAMLTLPASLWGAAGWSPDDRHVLVAGSDTQTTNILVVNLEHASVIEISAAVPVGWISPQTLAFVGDFCDNFDVMSVNTDGSELKRFMDTPDYELSGHLAPDGKQVVFSSPEGRELTLLALETGETRTLASLQNTRDFAFVAFHDSWSPSGELIVYTGAGGHGICEATQGPQLTRVARR